MNEPSTSDIQGLSESEVLTSASGLKADLYVNAGKSLFKRITGLTFDAVSVDDEPSVLLALRGLAEMTAAQASPDYLDTLADFDLIQNFSAGPYSETRRSPEDAMKARRLAAWPWLSDLLWTLLTPDQYDYWVSFFSGEVLPASAVQEVDWSAGQAGAYRSDWLVDEPGSTFFGA